ncbi:MAG: glycosyltransferase [Anaerolineae bacterium]
MSKSEPSVSVIIPTHNRLDRLPTTLQALFDQSWLPVNFEVIVVADGCVDGTSGFVKGLAASIPIFLVELSGLGPAAARNAGVKKSSGDVIIFLDDDIEVAPTFVEAHVREHVKEDNRIILGYLPLQPTMTQALFSESIQQWWQDRFHELGENGYRFRYGDVFTGNLSIQADLFNRLNGFDEALRCHEDYEFGYRATLAGANFAFSYAAAGKHHDVTDLRRSLRRRLAEGEADVYLIRRYPDLRYVLPIQTAPFSRLCRFLRWTAFKAPRLGKTVSSFLEIIIQLFMWLRMTRAWNLTFIHVQDYWYWHGISQVVSGPEEIQKVYANRSFSYLNKKGKIENVNLLDGYDHADEILSMVNRKRPDGVHFKINGTDVAQIPALMGAEKVNPTVAKAWLINRGAVELLAGRLFAAAQGVQNEPANSKVIFNTFPPNDNDFLKTPRVTLDIDLQDRLQPVPVPYDRGLHLLVKSFGVPLGWLTLDPIRESAVTTETIKALFFKQLDWKYLAETNKPSNLNKKKHGSDIPITVVVCTRNRPEMIGGNLTSLLQLDYPSYEILVIDNAPTDNATKKIVESISANSDVSIRYIRENLPGLDRARNRAVQEATYSIVAFTDDDARPDRGWLKATGQAFADPHIDVVTGPVLPAELETHHQSLFEFAYGGMSHGFKRKFIRGTQLSAVEKLWASGFGVGANMAYRKKLFRRTGLFDVSLDVGTPSNGGGDVEMLHRVAAAGKNILYEPKAYVWHHHRRSAEDLHQLMFNNGRSFGVYLMTCGRNRTVNRAFIAWFAFRYWIIDWLFVRLLRPGDLPKEFVRSELRGALSSPWAYFSTRRHARKLDEAEGSLAPNKSSGINFLGGG